MSLRESKGNMYDWVDYTWNPVVGRCPHRCSYCYMKRFWGETKDPRLNEGAFQGELEKAAPDKRIFVGSSIDLFAAAIPDEWIRKALDHCREFPDLEFIFQSKNPSRFSRFHNKFPKKTMIGTTVETNRRMSGIWTEPCPWPGQRVEDFITAALHLGHKTFITIEPVIEFDFPVLITWLNSIKPLFVNIGADSHGHNLPEPDPADIKLLIDSLRNRGIYVRVKRNLERILQ